MHTTGSPRINGYYCFQRPRSSRSVARDLQSITYDTDKSLTNRLTTDQMGWTDSSPDILKLPIPVESKKKYPKNNDLQRTATNNNFLLLRNRTYRRLHTEGDSNSKETCCNKYGNSRLKSNYYYEPCRKIQKSTMRNTHREISSSTLPLEMNVVELQLGPFPFQKKQESKSNLERRSLFKGLNILRERLKQKDVKLKTARNPVTARGSIPLKLANPNAQCKQPKVNGNRLMLGRFEFRSSNPQTDILLSL